MIIFENDFFVVHYRRGSSLFVLVTFTGIRATEALDGTYFAKKPCDKLDITAIGMVAKTNSWYRADGIHDALDEACRYTTEHKDVYTYGVSSGAYAAIKYSGLLNASYTIALAPQYSLDRTERPGEATEFDAYFCDDMRSMGIRKADVSGRIYVVRDPASRDDVIHAQWIERHVDNLCILPVFYTDHVISQYVKGTGNFKSFLSAIQSPSALFRALSAARRRNGDNQRNIIEAAIHKHPRLAARALNSYRCRSSGAYAAFTKNRRLVRMLLRHLLERREVASAGSLLCSTLYGPDRRPGPVDQARLLYFTSSGEMITYDPVERRLSSTDNLFPRNGCQLVLFSIAQENVTSFGYHTIDGSLQTVADKAWDGITMEPEDGFQHLRLRGRYLSAQPDGEIHANRLRPDLWERFYPLPLRHVTIHRPNLSHLATTRITAVGRGQNSIHNGADHTFIENWTVEGDFDHVRLIYMVDSSDQDLKIGAASIAAMSRLANNPAGPDDRALSLIAVTFNNKGLALDFEDQALPGDDVPAVRSLDLHGMGELGPGQLAMVPKLYLSDWMPLSSLRRADGGIGRLIHIRTEIPHHAGMRGVTTSEDGRCTAADPYRLTGRSYQTCFVKGQLADADHIPELNSVPAPAQGRGLVYGLQLISRKLGATLQMVGDSIGSGFGSSTNNTGFAQLAASMVSRPSLPVHFLQSGTYAQPSSGFCSASLQDLELSDVSIAIIQTWSGNDVDPRMTGEQAQQAADAAWQRALDYGRIVTLRDGVPIFLSAVPQHSKCATPEQKAARLSSVVRCRELSILGEFTIDLNGELGDGGSPATYAPRFLLDGLHPNQSGHEHIAALLVPMLETILHG